MKKGSDCAASGINLQLKPTIYDEYHAECVDSSVMHDQVEEYDTNDNLVASKGHQHA